MKNVLISYDAGGSNVMTMKRALNKFKHMPDKFRADFKSKIVSGKGYQLDGAFYSLTDQQITVL
jgi:hypothetical protein